MVLYAADGIISAKTFRLRTAFPKALHGVPPGLLSQNKGFQDIANLQVLDYLCGNYDRHYANMFYQFDRNGKLIGVQGIDNDGAFGVIAKKELGRTGENYLHMTNLSNMKAMPKQTAERLMALDAATLKYALRGFGLSEEELTAAEHRLGFLKQSIIRSRCNIPKGPATIPSEESTWLWTPCGWADRAWRSSRWSDRPPRTT